jgi:histone acetyltransferase
MPQPPKQATGAFVFENPQSHCFGEVHIPEVRIRDAFPKQEEKDGILEFKVVQNDGDPENMKAMIYLKDIFSKQLPKMPTEYISRLVLDRKHKALAMIKNKVIIGGIQFRPFRDRNFIEIVFCAVTRQQQVRGYGSYLMNHLKKYAQQEKLYHFLTYADNFAIGYFKKQGFTLEIELDKSVWVGVIKDYDGGTMMHCALSDAIDYMEAPVILQKQRRYVLDVLKKLSTQHERFTGFKEFAQFAEGKDPLTAVSRIAADKFQPLLATGWNPEGYRKLVSPATQKKILEINRALLMAVKEDKSSWPFLEPVDGTVVTNYYSHVEDPMDLQTMERKLDSGFYLTQEMMYADLVRMIENCKTYNGQGNVYFDCAVALETRFVKKWKPVPLEQL